MNNININKTFRKIIIIIVTIVIASIFIAILINELYKIGDGYLTLWSAADTLMYSGTIIAAIGAMLGVYFTIKVSLEQYKEDSRVRIMPFISLEIVDNHYDSFCKNYMCETGIMQNKKFVLRLIQKDKLQILLKLNENKQKALTKNNSLFWNCYFTNVGNGTATKVIIFLQKSENKNIETTEHSSPIMLKQNEKAHIGLWLDIGEFSDGDKYDVDFLYSDINNVRYIRTVQLCLKKYRNNIECEIIDKCTHDIYYENDNM